MHHALNLRRRLARRLRGEQGSMLIEVMVSATIVLVVGFGVLIMVDRTTELSGQQRQQAIAGNLAQAEIDTVKAFPIATLSNMRRTSTQTVSGVVYTLTTRADWINDTSMTPNCTTPGAAADYLKVQTTVTHPGIGTRRPAVLDTIVAPPVRSFAANQGSLAVLVQDGAVPPAPVAGATVSITGPANFSESTSANGCVIWGYLPTGTYTVTVSKSNFVTPAAAATASASVNVIGDRTTNATLTYAQGGSISTNFKVKNLAGNLVATSPGLVTVDNGTTPGFAQTYTVAGSALNTLPQGRIFPFSGPYSVYAGCSSANRPLSPATAGAVTLVPGGAPTSSDAVLPALHITVKNGAAGNLASGTLRVVAGCGNTIQRPIVSGAIADPGFPYGTNLTICATNGTLKKVLTGQSNTNVSTGTTLLIDIAGATSSTPNACP